MRSLIVARRLSQSSGGGGEESSATSYYLSSHPPGPTPRFAQLLRGHWKGCEIRNHGTRDVQWNEDATRCRNHNINANLALLRIACLALKNQRLPGLTWPQLFEHCAHKPGTALNMILK